jgi:hypothetical protein
MQIPGKNLTDLSGLVLLSISLLFAVSCAGPPADSANSKENANSQASNKNTALLPQDNAEELATLINLPQIPEEKEDEHADWHEETIASKGKKITAILKYKGENAAKITALAERHKPATVTEIGTEEWFPEELTAQTQLSGNESLRGNVYGANDFYNPPYVHGRLIRIQDTNYFVLELTTY